MQTVSALFNTLLANVHTLEWKVDVTGTATVFGMGDINNLQIYGGFFPGTGLSIGGTVARAMRLRVYDPTGVKVATVPTMGELKVYCRVKDINNSVSEWLAQGVFYVDTRKSGTAKTGGGTPYTEYYCYDAMLKAEQPYDFSGVPTSDILYDYKVAADIATKMGLTIDSRTTFDWQYFPKRTDQYTCREILSAIATMNAGNWVITAEGKLRLIQLSSSNPVVTLGDTVVSQWDTEPGFGSIEKVVLHDDFGNEYIADTGDPGSTFDTYCYCGNDSLATALLTAMHDVSYYPCKGKAILHPAIETGDVVARNGVNYQLGAISFTANGLYQCSIEMPGSEDVNHEYPFSTEENRTMNRHINRKAETVYGEQSSFGWELLPTHFAVYSNGLRVMQVTDSQAIFSGEIIAQSGTFQGTLSVLDMDVESIINQLRVININGSNGIFNNRVETPYVYADYGVTIGEGKIFINTVQTSTPTTVTVTIGDDGSGVTVNSLKGQITYTAKVKVTGGTIQTPTDVTVTFATDINYVDPSDGETYTVSLPSKAVVVTLPSGSTGKTVQVVEHLNYNSPSLATETHTVSPNSATFPTGALSQHYALSVGGTIKPSVDSFYNLGTPDDAWLYIYSNNQLQVTSDQRLKQNIREDVGDYSDLFDALKPKTFQLKNVDDNQRRIGFVAQDVYKAMVDNKIDPESLALLGTDGRYMGIKYGELIALCVHEIQELKAKVKRLMEKE